RSRPSKERDEAEPTGDDPIPPRWAERSRPSKERDEAEPSSKERPGKGPAWGRSGDARRAGLDGGAVPLGISGDAADGHVDAVAGGGALLFRLATPEAVLAVLTGPLAAGLQDHTVGADGADLGLADVAGLGPLPGRREEEVVLTPTGGRPGPGQWAGEDQARDSFGCGHQETPVSAWKAGDSGSRWGEPTPRVVLHAPCCPVVLNLSNS